MKSDIFNGASGGNSMGSIHAVMVAFVGRADGLQQTLAPAPTMDGPG